MTRPLDVVSADDAPAVLHALRVALTGDGPAVLPRAPRAAGEPDVPMPDTVPQRVALVIETSGSTGAPKRVALSADAVLAGAAASAGALGSASDGAAQWLLCLPAHYIAGANVLIRSITAGTDPVMLPPGRFEPVGFVEAARTMTDDARFVSLVPVQLQRLLHAATADAALLAALRRFDAILVGGQSLRPELRERAHESGLRVVRTYGSSETSGGCVYDGTPIGTVRARAVDGALEIAGPVLAEGYLDDEERSATSFHNADGVRWYRTGDLGAVDDDGTVTVFGRADNVIISGGEKVLLDAVERSVHELAGFADAVVVGVDDREWGQVPVVVVPNETSAALADVRAHVADALGRAAAPAGILEVRRLPLLPSGKPDRVAIARLAAADHTAA
jgi:O-succinylbenzoic acid--CoA ligase